jgi:hypothetical protein
MAGQIKTPSPIYGYEEDIDERCKERWKTVFRIRAILVRILIRLRLRILLFSSKTFKMLTKKNCSTFLSLFPFDGLCTSFFKDEGSRSGAGWWIRTNKLRIRMQIQEAEKPPYGSYGSGTLVEAIASSW